MEQRQLAPLEIHTAAARMLAPDFALRHCFRCPSDLRERFRRVFDNPPVQFFSGAGLRILLAFHLKYDASVSKDKKQVADLFFCPVQVLGASEHALMHQRSRGEVFCELFCPIGSPLCNRWFHRCEWKKQVGGARSVAEVVRQDVLASAY